MATETDKAPHQEQDELKKTTTDDGSSSDEEMPELEEGEVTEQQKKVAEAAGLSEQVQIWYNKTEIIDRHKILKQKS